MLVTGWSFPGLCSEKRLPSYGFSPWGASHSHKLWLQCWLWACSLPSPAPSRHLSVCVWLIVLSVYLLYLLFEWIFLFLIPPLICAHLAHWSPLSVLLTTEVQILFFIFQFLNNLLLKFFLTKCLVPLQSADISWGRGGIVVELELVCAGCFEAAVLCDLASTTVLSHCVWWLHGHSHEGARYAFTCPADEGSSKGCDQRPWEDHSDTEAVSGDKPVIADPTEPQIFIRSTWLVPIMQFPHVHYFQMDVRAWLDSVSGLNLDSSLEGFHPIITHGPKTTDSVLSATTDGSALPLFLQDQSTLGGTKELLEKVQVGDKSDFSLFPTRCFIPALV